MPYIKQAFRADNNPLTIHVDWPEMSSRDRPIALDTAGELNYAITMLISEYVRRRPLSYAVLNDVVGVLASAQAEFQRRVVAPYEDIKRAENGDVYNCLSFLPMETD